jgi:phenylacetate-CoA ligase
MGLADRRFVNPRLERATRAEIEAIQLARLQRIVTVAYERNRFYRALYDRVGVRPDQIRTIDDFRKRIPFIDKTTFLEDQEEHPPFGARTVQSADRIAAIIQTSGTSGAGQEYHCLAEADAELWTTGFFYECRWAGIEPGDRVVRFTRIGMEAGGLWHKAAGERYGLTQFALQPYDTPTRLKIMNRVSPNLIMTQPSYLTRLSFACEEAGIEPRKAFPDVKSIMLAGEAHGGAEWVRHMERIWGGRIMEWFGSTQAGGSHMFSCEGGLFFDDGRPRMLHNLDHRVFFEALDIESGEPVGPGEYGEVLLTNLFNENFPVIRFRSRDRVRYMSAGYCDCGRPFHGIESGSVSRVDDMIKIRGQNVWPSAIDGAVFEHLQVEEYQGRVWLDETGRERVDVRVEFRSNAGGAQERSRVLEAIAAEIKARTDISMNCQEVAAGTLPLFDQKSRRWTDERREGRAGIARQQEPNHA